MQCPQNSTHPLRTVCLLKAQLITSDDPQHEDWAWHLFCSLRKFEVHEKVKNAMILKTFDSDLKISDVIFQGLYWCSTVGSRHVLSQPNLVNQSLPLPITSRGPLSFSVLIYHSWFYHIAVSLVYCTSDFLDWVPPSFIRAVQHALSAFSSNLTREVHFHIPSLKPGLFSRLAGH